MTDNQANAAQSPKADSNTRYHPWRNRIVAGMLGVVLGAFAVGTLSHAGFGPGCGHFGHGPWAAGGPEAAEARREVPADRLEAVVRTYARLGLVPETIDLEPLLRSLLLEQVVGYYDPARDTLYVVDRVDELAVLLT